MTDANDVEVVTPHGELVSVAARLEPAQAAEQAHWLREMLASVLEPETDYGVIPGTGNKPTLLKAGAEMLILAAGLAFNQKRVDDEDAREHRGVTYRCEVTQRGHDAVMAVCEGYAGYDESQFNYRYGKRAPWNTIIKMAQKRALVGAALNAVAGSGLFVADKDDDYRPPALSDETTPPCDEDASTPPVNPVGKSSTAGGVGVISPLDARIGSLGAAARLAFDKYVDEMRWPWPPTSPAVIKAANKYLDALEAER